MWGTFVSSKEAGMSPGCSCGFVCVCVRRSRCAWHVFVGVGSSAVYFIGVGVVASLYIHYHRKINPKALDAIPQVFFSCNTWVGLTMMAAAIGVISSS